MIKATIISTTPSHPSLAFTQDHPSKIETNTSEILFDTNCLPPPPSKPREVDCPLFSCEPPSVLQTARTIPSRILPWKKSTWNISETGCWRTWSPQMITSILNKNSQPCHVSSSKSNSSQINQSLSILSYKQIKFKLQFPQEPPFQSSSSEQFSSASLLSWSDDYSCRPQLRHQIDLPFWTWIQWNRHFCLAKRP